MHLANMEILLTMAVGAVGAVAGVISLLTQVFRDRVRLKVLFLYGLHWSEQGTILQVIFQVSNLGNYPTSITKIGAFVLNSEQTQEAQLWILEDYRTYAAMQRPYDPQKSPWGELFLPQALGAHSSEVLVAKFRFQKSELNIDSADILLMLAHTHGQVDTKGQSVRLPNREEPSSDSLQPKLSP